MQVDGVAFPIWVIISEFRAGCILKDGEIMPHPEAGGQFITVDLYPILLKGPIELTPQCWLSRHAHAVIKS